MNETPKRILLKLSGEVLKGSQDQGICPQTCQKLAIAIKSLADSGIQIGIVVGGGNFYRGAAGAASGMPRTPADHIGMIATLMNGIAFKHALEEVDCKAQVLSGLECPKAVEPYNWHKAMEYLASGKIVIFVGGTGSPYFTTDTAAALRASEIGADMLVKATKVDGVYSKDPIQHADAQRYDRISYDKVLEEDLKVMDATAFALCRSSQIPILVFNMDHLMTAKPVTISEIQKSGSLIY
jgi:uridylate kinase